MDELWSFVHTKEGHLETAKRVCDTYGDAWVWVDFAPVWRLVVAFVVGKHARESANLLLERVDAITTRTIPLLPAINCPNIATPYCMSTGSGINSSTCRQKWGMEIRRL